jgi:hypothetical protein
MLVIGPMAMKQARRDLNPQPPDLESGALAVRATGPYPAIRQPALLPIRQKRSNPKSYRVSR